MDYDFDCLVANVKKEVFYPFAVVLHSSAEERMHVHGHRLIRLDMCENHHSHFVRFETREIGRYHTQADESLDVEVGDKGQRLHFDMHVRLMDVSLRRDQRADVLAARILRVLSVVAETWELGMSMIVEEPLMMHCSGRGRQQRVTELPS